MTKSIPRVFQTLIAAFVLFVPVAHAAPIGLVLESGITLRGTYNFSSAQAIAIAVEYETPLVLPIPIDFSLTARVGYNFGQGGGFDAGLLAKALVLNSFSSGLLGAGLWLELDARNLATNTNTFRVAFGPYLNINLDPLYATVSASLFSLTNGIYAFDLGLGVRYYLDVFAIELGFDYNTIGTAKANFGLRFTL
jgi:hypothetical protein